MATTPMTGSLGRIVAPIALLALVVTSVVVFFGGEDRKRVVAHFPRTISVYEGSDVRVLGVPVGEVLSVTPSGTDVVVEMAYDADVKVPTNAQAVIVAPSIVGDRYIQLTPAWEGGDTLADGTVLTEGSTAVPVELDQIYSSLNDLNVALGPDGANSEGALSDLVDQTAEQFAGQGESFNQTIEDFSDLSATLENNKDELFGATRQLGQFVETLAANDTTVREFNRSLARVSTLLADERQELGASLKALATALQEVQGFVADNRDALGRNFKGLRRVTQILVRQREAVDEILHVAPLALNNLGLTYNPQAGTLDTRSNTGFLFEQLAQDPTLYLCTQLGQVEGAEGVCDALRGALGNRSRAGTFGGGAGAGQERFDLSLLGLVEAPR